ncbi:MAG TPA: BON domain-containing protein [Bryobacteraceae bacterium]|jgi:hyperosmotically inducible protein
MKRWLLTAAACLLAGSGIRAQPPEKHATDQIAREVRHELLTLPYYEVFDYLTYRVEGSAVTLSGEVTHPELKTAAEAAVKQIEGVRSVVDHIALLPASPSDARLRLAVYVATYGNLDLNQYAMRAIAPVHIIATNGNVTLEGVVDNAMDKTQFFSQASGVPGVVSLTDHLQVAP